ncbi:PH domain-containing protein [Fodinibius halophilus]|uniref:PH domain-containing protein n=1 Tax=Fodinibius halophilus TaxID=1736908 RepID=A0A6M1TG12_9BACT|nr:PH domain-containing protein [Fodinibius halophilus]NGP89734.1 PH domain-containing protein [Fodinibius halophilus]
MRTSPEHKLSKSAIKAWRLSTAIACLFFILVPLFFWIYNTFSPNEMGFSTWVIVSISVVLLIVSGLIIFFLPEIRWQHWYYQVDEHEVDLQSGIFIITRTLIPVKRVQHVDTRQGPILRSYGLADVTISTAATTHRIPALDEETADIVRDRISKFARLAKEDV